MSGLAGDEPGPTRPAWTWGGWLLLAALFMVGCVNCPLQVLGTHLEYLPGDTADNILNIYILEHGYRCLTGQDQSFWDVPMYYPSRGVTAWWDAHLGMLPVYSCMRRGRPFAGAGLSGTFHPVFCSELRRRGVGGLSARVRASRWGHLRLRVRLRPAALRAAAAYPALPPLSGPARHRLCLGVHPVPARVAIGLRRLVPKRTGVSVGLYRLLSRLLPQLCRPDNDRSVSTPAAVAGIAPGGLARLAHSVPGSRDGVSGSPLAG